MLAVSSVVLVVVVSGAAAQTFGYPFPPVVIPDNVPGACLPPLATITKVVGVPFALPPLPPIAVMRASVGLSHTHYGDVRLTLSHAGVTVTLLGPPAPCAAGDSSDLLGFYTFDDAAPMTIDAAALATASTSVIPPGSYIGDGLLAAFAGLAPGGPWTFTIWDQSGEVTGTIHDARVSFGPIPTSYTFATGPGGFLTIAHVGGLPGNTFLNAVVLGTAGIPFGWFFGLDIPIATLIEQLGFGFPFSGPLDIFGGFFFFLPPGSLPSGLTISSVGVQINAMSGDIAFVSLPSTITIP